MKHILIYFDEGVSGTCARHLIRSLKKEVELPLKRIDAEQLLNTEWESSCALFIMPGGRDIPYDEKLGTKGAARIRNYVETGGRYLGICAGAYYASASFEFEKGHSLEVIAQRDLCFYPGMAEGSALGKGKYRVDSEAGVEPALITWEDKTFSVYYNGGCHFPDAAAHPSVNILAHYQQLNSPAIIECRVGEGIAILSGVHVEVPEGDETFRRELFRFLLQSSIPLSLPFSTLFI